MENSLFEPSTKFLEESYSLKYLRKIQNEGIRRYDTFAHLKKHYDLLTQDCLSPVDREELDLAWQMIISLQNKKPIPLEYVEQCYKPKLIRAGMSEKEANSSIRSLMPLSFLTDFNKLIEIDFQLSVIVDLIIHDDKDIYAIYIARGGRLFSIDNGIEQLKNYTKRSGLIYPRRDDLYSQLEQIYHNIVLDDENNEETFYKLKEKFISLTKSGLNQNHNFKTHARKIFTDIVDTEVLNSGKKKIRFVDTFGTGVTALYVWAIFNCLKDLDGRNIISEPFVLKVQKQFSNQFPSICDNKGIYTGYALERRYDNVLQSNGIDLNKLQPLEWQGHRYRLSKAQAKGPLMEFWPAGSLLSELKFITSSFGLLNHLFRNSEDNK